MAGLLTLRGSMEIVMHTDRVQDSAKFKAEILTSKDNKDWSIPPAGLRELWTRFSLADLRRSQLYSRPNLILLFL